MTGNTTAAWRHRFFRTIAFAALLSPNAARAQGAADDPNFPNRFQPARNQTSEPQARVDVLMVVAPASAALTLLPRLRGENVAGAERELLALATAGKARFIAWPELTLHGGVAGRAEADAERRYPSEFEPPQSLEERWRPRIISRQKRIANAFGIAGLRVPTSYELQYCGAFLDASLSFNGSGAVATIHCEPRWIKLSRFAEFPLTPSKANGAPAARQPVFVTHRASVHLALRDGERRLIHVGTDAEAPDQITLFICGLKIISPARAIGP